MSVDIYTASVVRYPADGAAAQRVEMTADAQTMVVWLRAYADDVCRLATQRPPSRGATRSGDADTSGCGHDGGS